MPWVKNNFDGFHSWLWANAFLIGMVAIGTGVVYGVLGSYHPIENGILVSPKTIAEYGAFGDYFGGLINPLMAFLAFGGLLLTIRQQGEAARSLEVKHDDEKYIEHAVTCMERAYSTLEVQRADGPTEVMRDRLAWLTCARLILSAKDAYARVSPDAHALRTLYEGEEEYWRRKFYLLLKTGGGRRGIFEIKEYFSYKTGTLNRGSFTLIHEGSVRVISEFLVWPDGRLDPIDSVPEYTDDEIEAMNGSMRGVREHLQEMRVERARRNRAYAVEAVQAPEPSGQS